MKKIVKMVKKIEDKSPQSVVKICFISLLVSLLVGTSLGFLFREFRLIRLTHKQKVQRTEEERRLNTLFEQFSKSQQNLWSKIEFKP